MAVKLWKHQQYAVETCLERRGSLFEMGLGTGKTLAALALADRRGADRVLVACPRSVVQTWVDHADAFFPARWRVVRLDCGSAVQSRRLAERAGPGPALFLVNWESIWRGVFGKWALGREWDMLVGDEAHRTKAPGSRVSKFMAHLARRAHCRLGLTGTPMPQGPQDIYGLYRWLSPTTFGTSYVMFRNRFLVTGGFEGRQVLGVQNLEEFREKYLSVAIQVSRDVLDLPPVTHVTRTFKLPPDAHRIYHGLREEFIADVGAGVVTVSNALTRLLRLAQVTSGHIRLDGADAVQEIHTGKQALLEEVLSEAPDEPVVVFARFTHDLRQIHQAAVAQGRACLELSGQHRQLEEWKAREGNEVLAVQIQSGSEGIDLTRSRIAVYFSIDFSLSRYEQSLARVHRPGQDRPVLYVHLIAENTVDRATYRALDKRRDVIRAILDQPQEI